MPQQNLQSNGGWIAKAGSCNIGFKPKPSDGIGEILLKGFELKRIKKRKPSIKIFWIIKVKSLNFFGWFLL